jgi:DNA helicase-2/ATP-dependent DNA helicase PcrA
MVEIDVERSDGKGKIPKFFVHYYCLTCILIGQTMMSIYPMPDVNTNQLKAICWNNGPMLVLGSHGSGKTYVLIKRVLRILKNSCGQHFKILVLTCTNKASAEMHLEIMLHNPLEFPRVRLATFESFAMEILQQHGSHIDIGPNFRILPSIEDREALLDDVLSKIIQKYDMDIPVYYNARQLMPGVDYILNRGLSPCAIRALLEPENLSHEFALHIGRDFWMTLF